MNLEEKKIVSVVLALLILVVPVHYFIFNYLYKKNTEKSLVQNPSPVSPRTPLPTEKNSYGYVSGHVTIGPICPVERVDSPCKVPPEVYTSREAIAYASDGTTIKNSVHLDTQGNYKIALSSGNYFVQIAPAGIGPGEKKSLTIKSNQTTVVDFDIDTGIR